VKTRFDEEPIQNLIRTAFEPSGDWRRDQPSREFGGNLRGMREMRRKFDRTVKKFAARLARMGA
jgi:hypothetical protein